MHRLVGNAHPTKIVIIKTVTFVGAAREPPAADAVPRMMYLPCLRGRLASRPYGRGAGLSFGLFFCNHAFIFFKQIRQRFVVGLK
jgi:hypothetical protein